MNAELRCELTELLVDQCAHCRDLADPAEEQRLMRQRLATQGWIPADYPGKCGTCGDDYPPGTMIRKPRWGDRRWVAECCAEEMSA